jgi:hypothetical protein
MLAHHEGQRWQDLLVARHPGLFLSGNHRTSITGYPLVGDGWRELVERAVNRIADALAAAPSGSVTIVEAKEKFATLRMYWRGTRLTKAAEQTIADAIALAEARSACTCEVCGRDGVLHQVGGQLLTACAEHAKGAPVPVQTGWENIHLVRGSRGGKAAILVCRRYDRASDSFVDVDPQSLGIEEEE